MTINFELMQQKGMVTPLYNCGYMFQIFRYL